MMDLTRKLFVVVTIASVLGLISACSDKEATDATMSVDDAHAAAEAPSPVGRFRGQVLTMPEELIVAHPKDNAQRDAYFGDLHVHTAYSFDAFSFGTLATPYDAYRYAKGEAIKHPAGFNVQLRKPLDFYAVTDHAMFLGAVKEAADPSTPFSQLPQNEPLHNLNRPDNMNIDSLGERGRAFTTFLANTMNGISEGTIDPEMTNNISRSAWADIVNAAEQYNDPGKFTTFVAYEYTTSSDDRGNLHRNVIFRGADKLPSMPFSRFHSQDPEGLWNWMDNLRTQGIETLAIPHNSNGSNGQMFKLVDWNGKPIDDAYAKLRARNEPLVEITQIKGTSETHPALSMNDEWADFEIMPYRIATTLHSEPVGSYTREALLNGLAFEDKGIANPYQFGFIGASDTHTAATSDDESNYFSKVGLLDSNGVLRGSVPLTGDDEAAIKAAGRLNIVTVEGKKYASGAYETWGASGLTGVWADANTRDDIYNAFRRKETFATSGPRIRVRLFGSFDFDDDILSSDDAIATAYEDGVAMGSELLAAAGAPRFIAWAMKDVDSAALQRLQIIKGWTVNGEHHEMVYDVACSDGGKVDPKTNRCPDNGANVNLSDCSITQGVGSAELKTLWQDPDFDPSHRAFYYARVLENPTCRWSTWDAIRAGTAPRPDLKSTIQERAWSSPIWLVPEDA